MEEDKSNIENFYKIFPVHSSTRTLSYTSIKNPNKPGPIVFELSPVLSSMRQKGKIAHTLLTKHIHLAEIEKISNRIREASEQIAIKQNEIQLKNTAIEQLTALDIRSKKEEKSLRDNIKYREKLESSIEKSIKSITEYNKRTSKLIESSAQLDEALASPTQDRSILGDPTNVFLPSFIFLVGAKSPVVLKKFFKVDFKPGWLPYFISTDQEDGIYHMHHEQVENARNEERRFFNAIGARSTLYSWESIEDIEEKYVGNTEQTLNALKKITGHSERVLTQALRNPRIVEHLVEELKKVMISEGHSFEGAPYKVYSITLLGHSTKVVCHQCARALVAQQASYEEGAFLQLLTTEINKENSGFRAYEHGSIKSDVLEKRQGIRCSTVIISEEHYNEPQLEAIRKFPSTEVEFVDNTVNIKTSNPLTIIELYKPALRVQDSNSLPVESKLTLSCSLTDKLEISGELAVTTKKQEFYNAFQNQYASKFSGGLLCIIASDDPANEKAFEVFSNSLTAIGKDFSEAYRKVLTIEYDSSSSYSIDYAALAFSAQQGVRFLPTVVHFFNILGVNLPKVNLTTEVKGSLDLALGLIKINANTLNNPLILGQMLESSTYYASLKTIEMLNERSIYQQPTDLTSLFNACLPELSNGLVDGISLMSPTYIVYGLISGTAQCVTKHQLFKEETTLQTNIRLVVDISVALTSAYITSGNILSKIMALMSNTVLSDISFKVTNSILDISLNGVDSEQYTQDNEF